MATEQELRQKVVDVAKGWIGKKEADNSYWPIIEVYNKYAKTKGLYVMTRQDAWCACFDSACFIQAGLTDVGFVEVSCPRMITLAQKAGRWMEDDAYVPQPGDSIMYCWSDTGVGDCTGTAGHVGLVESVNGNSITVIEGNMNDAVGRRNITVNSRYIRGYITPNFAAKATTKATTTTTTTQTTVTKVTTPTTTPTITDNEIVIWDYLYGTLGNAYAVAGIMGNLYAESGLFTNNLENTYNNKFGMTDAQYTKAVDNGTYTNFVKDSAGYGLAQWTYWSRKQGLYNLAKKNGTSISDVYTQLEFLVSELNSMGLIAKLKKAYTIANASNIVLTQFERPANMSVAVQNNRQGYSKTYYNKYKNRKNGTSTKPVTTTTATTTTNNSSAIKKGDKVKVVKNVTYTGSTFGVYYNSYDVLEVQGNRAVIGVGNTITAAINIANLQKV